MVSKQTVAFSTLGNCSYDLRWVVRECSKGGSLLEDGLT